MLEFLLSFAFLRPLPSISVLEPEGISILKSTLQPGALISFKETTICETTPGVKSYAGYVHLPSAEQADVGDFDTHTFFWFFEARNDPQNAPLGVYLSGGPGASSTLSAVNSENGPCIVNEDANSTSINQWSFNNHLNMLYIDQPVQTGYSYDTLIQGSFDFSTRVISPANSSDSIPIQNGTVFPGIFSSQDPTKTVNNTLSGAKALWHFAETWLTEFPLYKPKNNKISLFTNSYGGYYGPTYIAYFQEQFKLSSAARGKSPISDLTFDTLGITNGCIDMMFQAPSYPQMTVNNTYALEAIPPSVAGEAATNHTKSGGCRDLIQQCRALGEQGDPQYLGSNATVNEACAGATQFCAAFVLGAYDALSNRSVFDIAVTIPDPCTTNIIVETFLNQLWVRDGLGVPLNFTSGAALLPANFLFGTGDPFRRDIKDLESVLSSGVKVALIYGDRDYRCNWIGGEQVSLNANYPDADKFRASGYEEITTNDTYKGGVVRQYGGFSFSRVFDAGHAVSAYQPETVYEILMRSTFDRDIATGTKSKSRSEAAGENEDGDDEYQSSGPGSSLDIRGELPPPPTQCRILGNYS